MCLNSVHPMTIPRQQRLFAIALDLVCNQGVDLVNHCVDLIENEDEPVDVEIYAIPV